MPKNLWARSDGLREILVAASVGLFPECILDELLGVVPVATIALLRLTLMVALVHDLRVKVAQVMEVFDVVRGASAWHALNLPRPRCADERRILDVCGTGHP